MASYPNYQAIFPARLNLAYKWKQLSSYETVGGFGASPDGLGCPSAGDFGCHCGAGCTPDASLPEAAMNGLGLMTISPVASFLKSFGDATTDGTSPDGTTVTPDGSIIQTPDGSLPQPIQDVQNKVKSMAIAAGAIALGIFAVAGFYAGKAMAPSGSNKSMWGWAGVGSTLLAGPLGLGILGAVSLTKQDEI